MVAIRRARPEDAAVLAEFAARTFEESFGPDNCSDDMRAYIAANYGEAKQRHEIEDERTITLLAEDDGRLIAYAQMRRGPAPSPVPYANSIEIGRFYVDGPWQGRGVADALMLAVFDVARELAADAIWLGVWQRNARAIAFYKKHSFLRAGTQPFLLGTDLQTDDVMVCKLQLLKTVG